MTISAQTQPRTLAGAIWPDEASPTATRAVRAVILTVLGSLFVAITAQVQVPLWPVPVSGQTFGVLVVGWVNDYLAAQYGVDAIRYSMALTLLGGIPAAWYIFRAGKFAERDRVSLAKAFA